MIGLVKDELVKLIVYIENVFWSLWPFFPLPFSFIAKLSQAPAKPS